ncbi:MAG: tRNA (adenosine(37)-N6)-dimethylallyltransferase MiaA [Candidatus Saccharibacteria bacterium]
MLKLAAIVGPTGVGKSRIAVDVARELNGEIISCDSMQIYRGLNIGTAKITEGEMKGVPHYGIDIVGPEESYSVSDYQKMARDLIEEINGRGRLPILVGGTGLYYQAVVDDYQLLPIETDYDLRDRLNKEAENLGNEIMHERLQAIDPAAAGKISPNDRKRIVRALEVIEKTGRTFSSLQQRQSGRYRLAAEGLNMPREQLYLRLESRVDKMVTEGLIDEVKEILRKGLGRELNSMKALGYVQIIKFLDGEQSLEDSILDIKRDTRRYAKRQLTWFRRDDRIKWWDLTDYTEEKITGKICEHISRTIESDVE